MTFYQFITGEPKSDDFHVKLFVDMIRRDKDFPRTSDIGEMARYLYLRLDDNFTQAFQQCLMIWLYVENGHRQPRGAEPLKKVNLIIELQNNDPNYPWPRPIHFQRFGIAPKG